METDRLARARHWILSPRLPAPTVTVADQGQVVACPADLTFDRAETGDDPGSTRICFANRGRAKRYLVGVQVSAPWLAIDMNSEAVQMLADGFAVEHGPIEVELLAVLADAPAGAVDERLVFSFSVRLARQGPRFASGGNAVFPSDSQPVVVAVHVAPAGSASRTPDLGPLHLSREQVEFGNVAFFQEEEFALPATGARPTVRVWLNVLDEPVRASRARRRDGCDLALLPVPDGVAYYQVCRNHSTLPDPGATSLLALTPIGAASVRHLSRFSRQVTIRNTGCHACTLHLIPLVQWLEVSPSELSLDPTQGAAVRVGVLDDKAKKGLMEGLVRLVWSEVKGRHGSYDMPVSIYGAVSGPVLWVGCERIDFGKVLEGQQKVAEVPLANRGFGRLRVAVRNEMKLVDTTKVVIENFDRRDDAMATVPLTFHAERLAQGGRADFEVLLNSNTYFMHGFHRLLATAFVVRVSHTPEALDFGVITAGDFDKRTGALIRNDGQPVRLVVTVPERIARYVSIRDLGSGKYDCLFDARACRDDFHVQEIVEVQDAETGLSRRVPLRASVAAAGITCKLGLRDHGDGLPCVGPEVAAKQLDSLTLAVRSCGKGRLRVSNVDFVPLAERKRCHHLLQSAIVISAGDEHLLPIRLPVGLWSRWVSGERIAGAISVESNDPVYPIVRIPLNVTVTPRLGRRGRTGNAAAPSKPDKWFPRRE